jgi:RNA polymerase sigma-70 factor (ECF subfamily)
MGMQRFSTTSPSNPGEGDRAAEAALVGRCLAGDLEAFRDLYTRHSRRLYNLAYRMSGNEADAEELLQEVFLLAHRKLDTFKGEASLGTWLYRLATNLCLDRLRSKQGRMSQVTDPIETEAGRPIAALAARPMEAVLDRIDLERAIGRLPDSYRAAFVLHDVEGFDHREVGRMMGIAEGTSKSLLHKARLRLRALLGGLA